MKVKVLNNQSIFDIAVQESGTLETVFEIAGANELKITTIDEIPDPTTILNITANEEIDNNNIIEYYKRLKHKVATAASKLCILIDSESFILKDSTGAILIVKCF